jgi:hypothetical protein
MLTRQLTNCSKLKTNDRISEEILINYIVFIAYIVVLHLLHSVMQHSHEYQLIARPEHVGIAVGISLLPCLEAEIQSFEA